MLEVIYVKVYRDGCLIAWEIFEDPGGTDRHASRPAQEQMHTWMHQRWPNRYKMIEWKKMYPHHRADLKGEWVDIDVSYRVER